jgi:hypothetical protein
MSVTSDRIIGKLESFLGPWDKTPNRKQKDTTRLVVTAIIYLDMFKLVPIAPLAASGTDHTG